MRNLGPTRYGDIVWKASLAASEPTYSESPSSVPIAADSVATDHQASLVQTSKPISQSLSFPMRQSQNANVISSILDYLARPRAVAGGVFQSSDAQGLVLSTNRSFNFALDPYFIGKMQGFSGIRYTTNIRVAINASPFQQGVLRLSYYPNYRETPSKGRMHLGALRSLSQLPGGQFSLSEGGIECSVPFTSFMEYYDLETGRGDPFNWFLSVQSPLLTGASGPTNAKYTVWMWFTDVELFGATTVQPQSATNSRRKIKTRAPAAQEDRPLSTWLSSSSKLAASMSSIPLISGITGPSAYWLKRASTLANSFGYSRPVNGEPVRPVAPHYHSSLPNSDGINVSSVLAYNHDASCRLIDDFSPSGMDEMSVNFIKKQWAFLDEFSFSTATAAGSMVWTRTLSCVDPSVTDPYNRSYLTPRGFLGQLFRYYRGGFELDFRFVKTGFHAATISISYLTSENPPTTITESDTDLLHRTIVDIQEGDSICLSFPFISKRAWLETYMPYGAVFAHVINALIAPETVAPSVTVQVFVRGMDDLEYTGLADQNSLYPLAEMPLIEPQGGNTTQFGEVACAPVGATLKEPTLDGLAMMDSMSESITSVLVPLKAGSLLLLNMNASDVDVGFYLNPSAFACAGLQLPSTATAQPFACSLFNAIRSCYAYQRGGYELNILGTGATSPGARTFTVSQSQVFGSAAVYSTTAPFFNSRQTGVLTTDNVLTHPIACNAGIDGLSAVLPYKSLFRVNPIQPAVLGSSYDTHQMRSRYRVDARTSDTYLLRPAEDYQLLYWVGVPGLVLA